AIAEIRAAQRKRMPGGAHDEHAAQRQPDNLTRHLSPALLWSEMRLRALHQTKSGTMSSFSTWRLISASDGAASKRLAASSTLGSTWISPAVFRKIPARLSTQCTALSMSAWSSSGSYHVLRVAWRPDQG